MVSCINYLYYTEDGECQITGRTNCWRKFNLYTVELTWVRRAG